MKIFCLLVTLILSCNVYAADLIKNGVKLILIHPIQNYIELMKIE